MAMPGDVRSIREADVCPCQYDECSASASQEYCTEVDSMGAEWLPLCDDHIEQFKEDVANANALEDNECEWCHATDVHTAPFRDWQEGSQGPLYEVCDKCRGKSIDEANELANNEPEEPEEGEEQFATMPELSDDDIGQMFSKPIDVGYEVDHIFDRLTLHDHSGTTDLNGTQFNLNGPLLHDGQLGFSAHYQDGVQFALCLDLQYDILFWRAHFPREFYFVHLQERVLVIRQRIAALGYCVKTIEEL